MIDKQIFAALEITDSEVRLIVGEFFNTRFNIIKVERVACTGLASGKITDARNIQQAVAKAAANASKLIGASVQKVILAIPSFNMKRYSMKVTVPVEGIDQTVTVNDIRSAIKKAQSVNIPDEYALIQTVCVKYTVNGITSRRIPLNERCSELTVDIDLICADRDLSFGLVSCVEQAGLQVMDIFMDVYAVAKEAALFEQAVDRRIIILKIERDTTTLGLLNKGRLTTCFVQPEGVGTFAGALVDKYGLKRSHAVELVKYSARLDEKVLSDNPVYIWRDGNGMTNKITEKELVECIQPAVNKWTDEMQELCTPILQAGQTAVIITGDGGEMQGFNTLLQKRLNTDVKNYVPETLGGRNAGLTACLGLFYAYKDKLPITGYADSSLDMTAFIKAVSYREKKNGEKEDTITNKLKGILFEGKKQER